MVMRTIKIKNKYLIILVAAILLFGVVIPNLGGDVLFSLAERNFRKSNSVKALAYYNKLIERYPHHRNIRKLCTIQLCSCQVRLTRWQWFFPTTGRTPIRK